MRPDDVSVADHLALRQLKHEYCHRIDGGDYEGWVDLFTDDGSFVRVGTDRFEGRPELLSFAEDVFDPGFAHTAHHVTDPVVDVDGDAASGRWYLFLQFATPDGGGGWKQAVYEDEFRNVDGAWRIDTVNLHLQASESHELA